MGTLRWRPAKDGRRERLVIEWYDASGVHRAETIKARSLSGEPLSRRTIERDAQRRLAEHELEVNRQRAGLAPITSDVVKRPLRWLIGWWWDHRGKALTSPSVRAFVESHCAPIIDLPLRQVNATTVGKLIHTDLVKELSPKSRKHLRAYLFNAFEVARKRGGPWEGRANPIEEVDPVKVPKIPRSILQANEMEPVLARLEAEWRGPVAVGLFAGLREGEIFGLRKEDVDLAHGLLMVSRSWDAPRTKDGKALPVPIAPPLRPYLDEALKSPGRLLFPDARGAMRPRSLRLGKPLRRAIAAAGLVVGYEHRCRAWRCGWREKQPSSTPPRKCPRCGRRTTWAKALPRHVRFHDTRHSFGTALVRTAGLAIAQKGLRHSDVRLTADTYGHLDIEDLQRGVLSAFPAQESAQPPTHPEGTKPQQNSSSDGVK